MNNFYLLYGTDKSVINNELDKIINKLGTEDIVRYSLLDTLIEDVVMDASTVSMFSNKKIIILSVSAVVIIIALMIFSVIFSLINIICSRFSRTGTGLR